MFVLYLLNNCLSILNLNNVIFCSFNNDEDKLLDYVTERAYPVSITYKHLMFYTVVYTVYNRT